MPTSMVYDRSFLLPEFTDAIYEAGLPKVKNNGLWVNLLDMEAFIRVNDLKECTDPIFLSGSTFTPKGVLSQEIFGTSADERRNRFGYIDLHGYYMYPLAAAKLASYDRKLADCLFSRGSYKLTKEGGLEKDPEGESGPEFLYSIWDKIKVKDKDTESTKEVQKFFRRRRDKLFLTKFPVIPAFYRDINLSDTSSSKSSNVLNSKYSSIISYVQSLQSYGDGFGNMTRLTQARIQTLISDIYQELMIHTVKGQPAKFGMLRRSLAGKNIPYTARLVITATNLQKSSLDEVQVKFGHVTVPLPYICALFMPFMVHETKAWFDSMFLQAGYLRKNIKGDSNGAKKRVIYTESYDENEVTAMINKFINSPTTRFEKVLTPPDTDGKRGEITLSGRFNKTGLTFTRAATYTDILYIVAERVTRDKHVFITRYPLDNPFGQWPGRIIVSTTTTTQPVTIGKTVYPYYPVIKGDPLNVFMSTAQMSNVMIGPMGADSTITSSPW